MICGIHKQCRERRAAYLKVHRELKLDLKLTVRNSASDHLNQRTVGALGQMLQKCFIANWTEDSGFLRDEFVLYRLLHERVQPVVDDFYVRFCLVSEQFEKWPKIANSRPCRDNLLSHLESA